ncbi:retrovirus-related Pol polyprotein from transposon 17.6 [Trichonephila clavipes]|nr:retrovirus-related Pol polyprotein from transposon 17.6 [Trichonephila clavipes]
MRFMHEVLRGLPFCFVYLDDILCYSENAEEHRSHLRTIFQRLSSYGLKLNISKCVFVVTELIFLGHLITPDGMKPLPDKVQAVLDYKQPETVGSLRKFLGLLNFYRRFLPKAAEQQYLLSEFLKGSKGKKDSKPLNWSSEAITAFQRCKQALADAALLAHPSPSAPLALHVDASDYAIGGSDNIAADVLSRVSAITFPSQIDYDCIAETQQTDQELHTLIASGTSLELKRCKPAFFLNTEDFQLPQTKNETPATVEPNATASTPATLESDPTASTPTQPSTRSGRKVHLPTRYR